MKKLVILFAVLMLMSVSVFANGPLIGLQVAPETGSFATLTAGWDFGSMVIEGSKNNFKTWGGYWSVATLWTPAGNSFNYRLGPKVTWRWHKSGKVEYTDLALVVGVSKTWVDTFQVFGEFDIGAAGVLNIEPMIGLNILFRGFFPQPELGESEV